MRVIGWKSRWAYVSAMPLPSFSRRGSSRKRTGWLKKSRSHLSDGREAHLFEKRRLRAIYKEPLRGSFVTTPPSRSNDWIARAPLLGKEGNVAHWAKLKPAMVS